MRTPVLPVLVLFLACQRAPGGSNPVGQASRPATAAPDAGPAHAACVPCTPPSAAHAAAHARDGDHPVLDRCPDGRGTLLQRAAAHYDEQEYEQALSCAVQAAAAEPEDPAAQAERAAALAALGQLEGARLAFARTLALEPDHADALLGAAGLYLKQLPASHDGLELGLAYARRGRALAHRMADKALSAEFGVLEAVALNGLGRAREALARAAEALAAGVRVAEARHEKGIAHWELCQFAAARKEFEALLGDADFGASAHYHVAMLADREGDEQTAKVHFAFARSLDEGYPPEPQVSREEFTAMVASAVSALPAEMRRDLGDVPVTAEELPALEDLTIPDPPLSPEILGLFRGPPLDEACRPEDGDPCRSIVLYRRNLLHIVRDRAELEAQVRQTLIHEVGHLQGESDVELIARGLE